MSPVPRVTQPAVTVLRPQVELQRLVAMTFVVSDQPTFEPWPILRYALRGAALECAAAGRLAERQAGLGPPGRALGPARAAQQALSHVLYRCLRLEIINAAQFERLHRQALRFRRALTRQWQGAHRLTARLGLTLERKGP